MDRRGVSAHVEQVGALVWMHFQYSAALEYVSLFCVSLLQDDDMRDDAEGSQGDSDAMSPSKKVKRGRALQRRNTDEDKVPFMTHVVSPELVKEFMYELKSKWAIFGTSEVGVAARGALALKHPIIMFANNPKHEDVLREGLEAGIVESCLAGGDFSTKTLTAAWQAAQGEAGTDSETCSDGQTSDPSDGADNSDEQAEKEKGHSGKKEKDKKDKKDSKKEKKGGKSKKEKKGKKVKKVKKPKLEKRGKSDGAVGGTDVLKALIANGSGAKG